MSSTNEFDKLVQRKLDERQFPFEEAHWAAAERAIAEQKTRRRGWLPWIGVAAALLIGAWLLWPAAEPNTTKGEAIAETKTEQPNTVIPAEAPSATEGTRTATTNANTIGNENTSPRATHVNVNDGARDMPIATPVSSSITKHTQAEQPVRASNIASGATTTSATAPKTQQDLPGITDQPTVDPQVVATPPEPIGSTSAQPVVVDDSAPTPSTGVPDIAVPATVVAAATDAQTAPTDPVPTTATPAIASDPPIDEPLATTPSATNAEPVQPTPDSLTAVVVVPKDSVTTAPTPVPTPPPIIDPRAPWEVSLLGGLFNTTSTYAGGASDSWTIAPERTTAFGAELMHMGRNFGIGSGLHYGTYADRLTTPEVNRSTVTYDSYWSLVQIDTTVLFITGFDPDSGVYTGINVDITMSQLRLAMDSSFTSVRVREASERVNRTSYFELPLLLDAHLVQGRWSLGVRGGPTVGMLTQRQGSIPNSNGEGYADLNDVAMRSWMFGWTARAYVRYRFNSAWSVGLEPAARGQFMDNLEDQGVTRRSSALGGMLSLSYRLP